MSPTAKPPEGLRLLGARTAQRAVPINGTDTWAKFRANYVGVVAGMTRHFFTFRISAFQLLPWPTDSCSRSQHDGQKR
jgi:hypothetical protein